MSVNESANFDDVMSILSAGNSNAVATAKPMSIQEYLTKAAADPSYYATAAERLLKAIGEPESIDTREDTRLSRIYENAQVKKYPGFEGFHGKNILLAIMDVVNHLKAAANGLEEARQVLYLLGPVGGGKSSIAEKLKELMQKRPFYALQFTDAEGKVTRSPINESPLPLIKYLLNKQDQAGMLQSKFGIGERYLKSPLSPWALKRLDEWEAAGGNMSAWSVVELKPSIDREIAISKTEPGDENNQDISSLVGKVDIRKLDTYGQDDPDAYSFSGGLGKGHQGLMEFVEMFKAPIKVLHPLLTATQEGNYKGVESIGNIPWSGILLAHSNESEWSSFKNNKNNEAFLDRINVIKIKYALEVTEEAKIYKKMLDASALGTAPCAPETLSMLAKFSILTRLVKPEDGGSIFTKLKVYDGLDMKEKDTKAKTRGEYEEAAGLDEGTEGVSTRWAFKVLSQVYNASPTPEADPVLLMGVLQEQIVKEQWATEVQGERLGFMHDELIKDYFKSLKADLSAAYLENSESYGQQIFDTYIAYAQMWKKNQPHIDQSVKITLTPAQLHIKLQELEKPAGVNNFQDFRQDVVMFALEEKANTGRNPNWRSFEKMKDVIEKKIFQNFDELVPLLAKGSSRDEDESQRYNSFINNMKNRGYETQGQIERVCEWYLLMKPKLG